MGQHGHPKAGGHGIPHATGGHGHELGQHFGFTALQDLIGRRLFHDAAQRATTGIRVLFRFRTGQPGQWIHDGALDGCGDGAGQFGPDQQRSGKDDRGGDPTGIAQRFGDDFAHHHQGQQQAGGDARGPCGAKLGLQQDG